jgi:hydrogenase nickel incorporation protein HypA/HybF
MHEVSLIRSVLTQVEHLVAAQRGRAVQTIRLQCGPLSGVEPALLLSAFELLRDGSDFCETSLVVEEVPLRARCLDCDTLFAPERFCFVCPRCGGDRTAVTQGDALMLESIELEPAAESEPV